MIVDENFHLSSLPHELPHPNKEAYGGLTVVHRDSVELTAEHDSPHAPIRLQLFCRRREQIPRVRETPEVGPMMHLGARHDTTRAFSERAHCAAATIEAVWSIASYTLRVLGAAWLGSKPRYATLWRQKLGATYSERFSDRG